MADLDITVKAKDEASKTLNGINSSTKTLTKAFKVMGGILSVGILAKGIQKMLSNVTDLGDQFDKMAKRTGETTEFLSSMAHVAELAGTNIQTLEGGFRRAQRTISDAKSVATVPSLKTTCITEKSSISW